MSTHYIQKQYWQPSCLASTVGGFEVLPNVVEEMLHKFVN
jgi:hypothetical protein